MHGYTYHVNGQLKAQGEYCESDPPEQPDLTMDMILKAWEDAKPGQASLVVSPPGGETLVNLPTIFSTDAVAFDYGPVELAGHQVVYHVMPSSFAWSFGDGATLTSRTPGSPYSQGRPMSDYLTHTYLKPAKGLVPRLTITWTGTFSADGAAHQPLQASKSTQAVGAELDVVEAEPVLTE